MMKAWYEYRLLEVKDCYIDVSVRLTKHILRYKIDRNRYDYWVNYTKQCSKIWGENENNRKRNGY